LLIERDQAPIGHLTPHTLRRTFASVALVSTQGNLKQVMRMLGHTNPRLTMSVYAQLLELADSDYEEYGARVDSLIAGVPNPAPREARMARIANE